MQHSVIQKGDRRSVTAFWIGTLAVVAGVGLHLPMFIEAGETMHYHMAGMPMDTPMLAGMFLILGGTVAVAYGLLAPKAVAAVDPAAFAAQTPMTERSGRMSTSHWQLAVVLTVAIVVDVMKPATLGFVLPGLAEEYGISRSVAALLPFVALSGTTVGSLVWGYLGDRMGRRAAILLSAIIFIATSICGAMPAFEWNLVMCFLMGASAGGMLPIAYTLLAEIAPAKNRGWFVVLPGALGMAGGFLVASLSATLLEPHFGWRILWFLGLPTGLIVILLNHFIPESPRFLLLHGRVQEAREVMKRFGGAAALANPPDQPGTRTPARILLRPPFLGPTLTLNFVALIWGLVNFGFLLWLPSDLRARGYSAATADGLMALSSLIALPTAFLTAWLYNRWSTRNTLVLSCGVTTLALAGLAMVDHGFSFADGNLVLLIALLMFGCSGIIGMLLPYGAENYPLQVRGRGTGLVAGSSKFGGIGAQVFSLSGLVPQLATAALVLALPVAVSGILIARFGAETRGRKLEALDDQLAQQAAKELS